MLEKSYLLPMREEQKIQAADWIQHTSVEHKWELINGLPFGSALERDRLTVLLLTSMGWDHLLHQLSKESIEQLAEAIKGHCNKKS